ncbi:MAG: M16 family metallopeptidase [Armatimonadota bacterium]
MTDETKNICTTRLPSGVIVITESVAGMETAAVGFWTDAGPVDELPCEYGQSHLIEHMLFKGTATRSAYQLAEDIENIGGQVNAYTERETIHVHAHILADHLPNAIDVLSDMVCHSTFAPAELEIERQVIIEEIRKYDSLPEERIHDLIMEGLWSGGKLGHPILGTEDSVRSLTRDMLLACWKRYFAAEHVLITAAGKIDHERFVDMVAEAFRRLPPGSSARPVIPEGERRPAVLVEEEGEQVYCCLAGRSYPARDDRNYALAILDSILGGSTTSRLFQEVREKRGLAYDISSYLAGFREAGVICATYATGPETFITVLDIIRREIQRLCKQGVTPLELWRAKEQLKAATALSLESTPERMQRLAMHYLTWGKIESVSQIIDRFNRVSMEEIDAVLADLFNLRDWTLAAIGPFNAERVRATLRL